MDSIPPQNPNACKHEYWEPEYGDDFTQLGGVIPTGDWVCSQCQVVKTSKELGFEDEDPLKANNYSGLLITGVIVLLAIVAAAIVFQLGIKSPYS